MKFPLTLFVITLLTTGCANFPAGTGTTTGDNTESTADTESTVSGDNAASTPPDTTRTVPPENKAVRERKVQFGNWRVDCTYEAVTWSTQCKAETYGKITRYYGDEIYHPTPVLWVSWLKGEPENARSVCVFGHDYPVKGVSLQVDDNRPFLVEALSAAGCIIANQTVMHQLRNGQELTVTFMRWPWGETRASFSLNKSINALNELDRLVAGQ